MNTEHLMLHVWQPSPLRASLFAFLLHRQASRCTPKTLEHYEYTCGSFVEWLGVQGILDVGQITAHHIRAYLVSLQPRALGLRDLSTQRITAYNIEKPNVQIAPPERGLAHIILLFVPKSQPSALSILTMDRITALPQGMPAIKLDERRPHPFLADTGRAADGIASLPTRRHPVFALRPWG